MKFENKNIKITYNENWEKQENEIKNCLLVLDHKNKKSRIMLMEYPNQAVNITHLKTAIELFPRDENFQIVKSEIIKIKDIMVHELEAVNPTCKPILQTKSIGLINKKDVYIFNYMSFGLDNTTNNDFQKIIESIELK